MTGVRDTARLRAVLLPPTPAGPGRAAWRPGLGPDPFALDRKLASHGIDLTVIDPGRWPLNPLAGRGSVLESIDPLRALRVMTTERRADIVISVFEGGALALLALRRALGFSVPCVIWDVGLTDGWALRERILDRVVPRASALFVLSESQRAYIASRWGRRDGVEVLGHAIDTGFFTAAAAAAAAPDGPVLSVGEDVGRDFASLLAIAGQIDAQFVIKTRSLQSAEAMPANVTVLRDQVSLPALRDMYAACRFAVVPLHRTLNASGVSTILEAAAMGRASVVSDNPAIRDFIIPDQTCLVVPCGDAAALRDAINRLLHDPESCARLGEGARRFAERCCAPDVITGRMARLLRRYARDRPVVFSGTARS